MKTRNKIKVIQSKEGEAFDIELDQDLLKRNVQLAQENKKIFEKTHILAIDILGSIGSGKTSLIENILTKLKERKVGVIAGDLTTTIDAERIKKIGARIIQVNTGKECHLDANLIRHALDELNLEAIDLLFIENVGNLICPGEFPLGAHKRVIVISVTEGPYMIVKHPYIFHDAAVVVINKIDLADAMEVDPDRLEADAFRINPRTKVIRTNCRTGQGVEEVIETLNLQKEF